MTRENLYNSEVFGRDGMSKREVERGDCRGAPRDLNTSSIWPSAVNLEENDQAQSSRRNEQHNLNLVLYELVEEPEAGDALVGLVQAGRVAEEGQAARGAEAGIPRRQSAQNDAGGHSSTRSRSENRKTN
jgi:hypothetical protein